MGPTALPPHRLYYLHNFVQALEWVRARYADLLDMPEQDFIARFAQLPEPAQALLVRLVMRRGPWFRAGKLVYEEIGDIDAAAAPLLALGWLDATAPMALTELFALHTHREVAALFAAPGPHPAQPKSLTKAALLQALQPHHTATQPYRQWHPASTEAVWRVAEHVIALCTRLRLLFFGNLFQDWSEFVLADLGLFQYEVVPFDAQSRAFQCRADVDHYLALHALRQALDDGAERAPLVAAALQATSPNPWLQRRRAKLLMRIGQACEKAADWALAEQAYAHSTHPGARHRRIRVHEHLGRHADALALALQAQAAPESDEESQRLARMLPRLLRAAGPLASPASPQAEAHRTAATTPLPPPLELALPHPGPTTSVEWALRHHWHTDEAPVFYTENALINSLFGLLCWPAVFAPLPGAFFHPFQSAPADLNAPDFVERRADLFAECLRGLEDGRYRALILERFASKQGRQSPYVFWGALSEPLLQLALECMPAAHLRLLFERLLQAPVDHRSGLPDLVRFWPTRPVDQRYELVEVKGPGDKLQDNQIRWLQYCHAHGLPASVCHVRWQGAPGVEHPTGAVAT
ncbi:VRR-NUC domain-containing protein [Acidovorax sp. 106]|uniref:VRR-NUC domain-containing protein n=1 Tax=Acidovorax sp. 106 TaxID=2135637 RepID=UPI000F2C8954|nr:VRR-NUC domain-containing protein [Acidovorax sp. 106]RLJ38287.1 VRR-NUC domain-containing protein [Acidovorax sp. 106]